MKKQQVKNAILSSMRTSLSLVGLCGCSEEDFAETLTADLMGSPWWPADQAETLAIGEVSSEMVCNDYVITVYDDYRMPIGTKLYTAPQPAQVPEPDTTDAINVLEATSDGIYGSDDVELELECLKAYHVILMNKLSAPPHPQEPPQGDTPERLIAALRQYRHNDGEGLLAGYDIDETNRVFDEQAQQITGLIAQLDDLAHRDTEKAQRIAELEAHCQRLKEFTDASCEDAFSDEWIARQHDAWLETPAQSLAHIKADAMMEVAKSQRHFIEHLQKRISESVFYPKPSIHMLHMMTDDIEEYANSLRNGAEAKT